jgi:hypothetical protein
MKKSKNSILKMINTEMLILRNKGDINTYILDSSIITPY